MFDTGTGVGIGTATPGALLDVSGSFNARQGMTVYSSSTLAGYVASANGLFSSGPSATSDFGIRSVGSFGLSTNNSVTPSLVVNTSGNIGIGTTNPTGQKLWVVGGDGDQMALDNSGQNYTALRFKNNGTNKAEIDWYNPDNSLALINSQA